MPLAPRPEPRSFGARVLGFCKGFSAAIVLLPTLVFINLLQSLSMLIKPISGHLVRRFNRGCANFWWSASHLWAAKLYGIQIELIGDDVPPEENVVLISNHQETTDIPVLFKLAYEKQRLGDLKWYVKDIVKYIPGIGWGMLFLDCLFVKRNWTSDQGYITGMFEKILRHKVPVWVISFVEGTRGRPAKLAKSNEYAAKKGMAPTRHLLLPRTKGFAATVMALRDHLDAVYDVTIGYTEGVPGLWQWFKGYPKKVYLHVQRFPTASLPDDEGGLSDWLTQQWYKKDQMLDEYYETDVFPAGPSDTTQADEGPDGT